MASKNVSISKRGKVEITSHGGYMADKVRKLDNQFQSDIQTNQEKAGTASKIFVGVCIHVNGYTDPSSDELKRLMMLHGGAYQHYYSLSKVTHIIATNLPYTKIRQLRNEKIVKPEWITESIKAGYLLPSRQYELYTDRSSGKQSLLSFSRAANCSSSAMSSDSTDEEEGHKTSHDIASSTTDLPDVQMGSKPIPNPREHVLTSKPVSMATAGNANFLSEFYSHSRLHHISTWGAECKAYVNLLQSNGKQAFPGRQQFLSYLEAQENRRDCGKTEEDGILPSDWRDSEVEAAGTSTSTRDVTSDKRGKRGQTIMHVDMDCFFVSVGLVQHPELIGQPVAVTHSKGQVGMSSTRREIREIEHAYYAKKYGSDNPDGSIQANVPDIGSSAVAMGTIVTAEPKDVRKPENEQTPKEAFHSMAEIASCNYEARKLGVKNGMFMGKAKTLCPHLQTIPYDFEAYKKVSQMLYDIVASFTHEIEAVSCDEMFVDIIGILEEAGAKPEEFAQFLRAEIKEKTSCNASCGMASNILLARMATRKAKPNGQFFLESHAVDDFIKPQPVKDLPGVGWSMSRKLEKLNIKTCRDLQFLSQSALQKEFGPKTGLSLYRFCRGLDDRPIRQEQERKSVSAEVNYGIRFRQDSDSDKFIVELATEVHKRLRAIKMQARTITVKLKVRHPDAPKETSKFMGHGICEDKARSCTIGQATDDLPIIQQECRKLLKDLQAPAVDMRGVGIQLSKLSSRHQQGSSTSTSSKSITSFMTKPKPGVEEPQGVEPQRKEWSVPTSTCLTREPQPVVEGTKKGARTMLNFSSKQQPSSVQVKTTEGECHGDLREPPAAVTPMKKERKELPPLPFMPSNHLPTPNHRPSVTSDLALPSPSQIDMSVLSALPRDMQEQILQGYQSKRQTVGDVEDPNEPSTSAGTSSHSGRLPPSGPRHLLEEGTGSQWGHHGNIDEYKEDSPGREQLGVVEALPSFSQIDTSCLEALPPELQEELRAAYREKAADTRPKQQEAMTIQTSLSPGKAPNTRSPFKASPAKKSPAKKSPAKSPFKIKRRVKARTGTPKKPRWQVGIQELVSRNQSPSKLLHTDTAGLGAETSTNSKTNPHQTGVWNPNIGDEVMREEEEEKEKENVEELVNLCGAVELWDVKKLLREWIASTDDPVEEDVGVIVQYLRELILDCNLETMDLVMKALKRLIARRDCPSWRDAHETVVARIQHTIHQIYSAQLKIT